MVSRRKLNAKRLREAVHAVLTDERYGRAARSVQAAMRECDGLERAADIIEDRLGIGAGNLYLESAAD